MKILNITGYNFSDPSRVFYNGESELDVMKRLDLVNPRTIKNPFIGNLTEWRNYKKILDSFKADGYTHITNDDDSVDIHGDGESKFEDPIDDRIQHAAGGIEYALSLSDYDNPPMIF
jgi:hypothetical protein